MTPPAPPALTAAEIIRDALTFAHRELWATYGDGSASGERITAIYAKIEAADAVLAALAAPPPDAGLVALVAELQASAVMSGPRFGRAIDALLSYPLPARPTEPTP